MILNNKGFTLIELMVAIIIATTLTVGAMVASSAGVNSSSQRNLNDEYKYVKLFFNDLTIPTFKVINRTDTEETNYQGENKGYEKKSVVTFEIPYVEISFTKDYADMPIIDVKKKSIQFFLDENENKRSSQYVLTGSTEKSLNTLRNRLSDFLLVKGPGLTYDTLDFDHSINEEGGTDYELRDKKTGKVVFKRTYSSTDGKYEITSDYDYDLLNNKSGEKNDTTKIKIGFASEDYAKSTFSIFKMKTYGTYVNCIVRTPTDTNVFTNNFIKKIIKSDVYHQSFDFTEDQSATNDYCDYDLIYPIMSKN